MDNFEVCSRHIEREDAGTYIKTAQARRENSRRTVQGTADRPEGDSNRRIGEAGLTSPWSGHH